MLHLFALTVVSEALPGNLTAPGNSFASPLLQDVALEHGTARTALGGVDVRTLWLSVALGTVAGILAAVAVAHVWSVGLEPAQQCRDSAKVPGSQEPEDMYFAVAGP